MEKIIQLNLPSPLVKVDWASEVNWLVKRDDLIHPQVSGNKYRKLKYIIEDFRFQKKKGIISFGGSFSNHIYAVSAYGALENIPSIGIIRGEPDPENPTLKFASDQGMQLFFVPRSDYKEKNKAGVIESILASYPDYYIVPEGGDHPLAEPGVSEIITELESQDTIPDYLAVAVGTGSTASALIKALKQKKWPTKVLALPVVNDTSLQQKIIKQADVSETDFVFMDQYTLGGYAKTNKTYLNFLDHFMEKTNIPVDPVYNGKLVYALTDLIHKNYFKPQTKIVWLHTGGLQGIAGFDYRKKKKELKQMNRITHGNSAR